MSQIIPITLTDAVGNQASINAGYVDGKFFISEFKEPYVLTHETVRADLNGILSIDGNAWRDIERDESLETFIESCVEGSACPVTYISNLYEKLNCNGDVGKVICDRRDI